MNVLKNIVVVIIACVGFVPTTYAHWLEYFPKSVLKESAPLAFPIRRGIAEKAYTNAALSQASALLAQTNFIKDILRQNVTEAVYMEQIDYAERVYRYIDFLNGTSNSLSVEIVDKLSTLLHQVTLMNPVIRQVWVSTLQAPYLSEEKYPILLKQMRNYFGFDTAQDVKVLAKEGNLVNNPIIQRNVDLYRDFTERLEKFVKANNRIPQEIAGVSGDEEIALAREYRILQFVKPVNNFDPIRPYIEKIEALIKTVK